MIKLTGVITLLSTATFALQVYPIPINIDANQRYKELHVEQDTGKYQVYLKRWSQKDGKDILTDTKKVVAYPKIIQAPKRVKIYRKQKGEIKVEKAYRVILKELNIKSSSGETKVVKTLSIPVFILPYIQNPKLNISCIDNVLELKNSGNMHYKVLSINGKKNMQYILPNQIKEVRNVEEKGMVKTNRGDLKYKCKQRRKIK